MTLGATPGVPPHGRRLTHYVLVLTFFRISSDP